MIRSDMIPDEVVEAAARKFAFYAGYTWGSKGLDHDAIRGEAAMVILSALNAWPGIRMMVDIDTGDDSALKLPLPQEVKQSTTEEERA